MKLTLTTAALLLCGCNGSDPLDGLNADIREAQRLSRAGIAVLTTSDERYGLSRDDIRNLAEIRMERALDNLYGLTAMKRDFLGLPAPTNALCSTDSDCAARFPGSNGDPEPVRASR